MPRAARSPYDENKSWLDNSRAEAPSAGGLFHRAIITLTDAQIKALPTTGIEIVPALGENKHPILRFGRVFLDFRGGVYTNVDANASGKLYHSLGADVNGVSTLLSLGEMLEDDSAVFVAELIPSMFFADPLTAPEVWGEFTYVEQAEIDNSSFKFKAENAALGDFTGGHADNSIRISLIYSIVDSETGQFE